LFQDFFSTEGFTMFGGICPWKSATTLFAAITAIFVRVSSDADASAAPAPHSAVSIRDE